MSRVAIADVDGNMFMKGLINEGVMLKFGVGGKYLGEFPISFNVTNIKDVDIISILSDNTNIEIGLSIDESFSKFTTNKHLVTLNDICLNKLKGLDTCFRRELSIDGVNCTQYIYIYNKGILKNYNLREIL